MMVFLLLLVWDWGTVMFKLYGSYCECHISLYGPYGILRGRYGTGVLLNRCRCMKLCTSYVRAADTHILGSS